MKITLIASGYFLIIGLSLLIWYRLQKEIKRVENSVSLRISEAANNVVDRVKTPPPIKEELKGKGEVYSPSRDIDRMLSGKHVDFY